MVLRVQKSLIRRYLTAPDDNVLNRARALLQRWCFNWTTPLCALLVSLGLSRGSYPWWFIPKFVNDGDHGLFCDHEFGHLGERLLNHEQRVFLQRVPPTHLTLHHRFGLHRTFRTLQGTYFFSLWEHMVSLDVIWVRGSEHRILNRDFSLHQSCCGLRTALILAFEAPPSLHLLCHRSLLVVKVLDTHVSSRASHGRCCGSVDDELNDLRVQIKRCDSTISFCVGWLRRVTLSLLERRCRNF